MTTMDIIRRTKAAWRSIHTMTAEDKSRLLQSMAESLQRHTDEILRCNALVVKPYGQRTGSTESVVSKVCQIYDGACHLLSEAVRGNAAAEHEVCLNGMTDRLMRKHSRKSAAEYAGALSRLGVHALALFHNTLVHAVHLFVKAFGRGEYGVECAESAEGLKQLNGNAARRFRGHADVHV